MASLSPPSPETFTFSALPPDDMVDVQVFLQDSHVQFDIRYYTYYNFVGRPIAGYEASKCFLTRDAAHALKNAVDRIEPFGLTFKIYDGYRPQTAVNDFIVWSQQLDKQEMKQDFYPEVDKKNVFKEGYLVEKSAHSRGSTVDLTLVPMGSTFYTYPTPESLEILMRATSQGTPPQKFSDNSLDFGTPFDYFSLASHPSYPSLTAQQKANRALLQMVMMQAGFLPITTEWWHFQLANEPHPHTYFDFPITEDILARTINLSSHKPYNNTSSSS